MKNFIDKIINQSNNLIDRNEKKQINLSDKSLEKTLDVNLLYSADLFYNEKFPAIEFTFREKKADLNYFMCKHDRYFGSWDVKGEDLNKVSNIFTRLSSTLKKKYILRDTNRIASEMNKLNFKFNPIEGKVVPEPFEGRDLYKAKVINN
tara:strand:+ start:4640 stop:5086 length:447 start_codon:yes stop_codon:yes gene_type:complete